MHLIGQAMCLNTNSTLHCMYMMADAGRVEDPAAGCFPASGGRDHSEGTATRKHPNRQEEPTGTTVSSVCYHCCVPVCKSDMFFSLSG